MTDSQDNHLSEHRHDDDLEIDEVAPSEDERIAEAALRDDGREASGFPGELIIHSRTVTDDCSSFLYTSIRVQ